MPQPDIRKRRRTSFELSGVAEPLKSRIIYGLGGAIAIMVGAGLFWQPAEMTLSCQRSRLHLGVCQMTSTGLFHQKVRSFPLESLKGADWQANGKAKFVVLLVDDNRLPMPTSVQQTQVRNDRDRINTFVQDRNQTTLLVSQDSRADAYPKAFALLMFGGVMLGLAKVNQGK